MTILSSVAQQEVENTSAYVKKGLKMKMQRGELVGFQGCIGYDYDPVTKKFVLGEPVAGRRKLFRENGKNSADNMLLVAC